MKMMALTVLAVAWPGVAAAQSATYAFDGFALTLHQAQVTGLGGVQEELSAPIGASAFGFPASPAQALILTPREVAGKSETAGDPSLAGDTGGGQKLLLPASAARDR